MATCHELLPLDKELVELFDKPLFEWSARYKVSLADYQLLTIERVRALYREQLVSNSMWLGRSEDGRFASFMRTMGWVGAYDFALLSAIVDHQIAGDALLAHASELQLNQFKNEVESFSQVYCFAATEIGYGSDLKSIGTVVEYDRATDELCLTTPTPETAKCWIGNSLYSATVAMVLARLIVDGQDEGHHWFRVPLRAHEGAFPFPGISIRPAEPKGGIVANQTGIITFDRHRMPVGTLMSRWAGISNDGMYHSSRRKGERFVECLHTFVLERAFPVAAAACGQALGLTIALRYSQHRKVFGGALIEHPHYRQRIIPLVARGIAQLRGTTHLMEECQRSLAGSDSAKRRRLHGIVSMFKAWTSWDANEGLQQLRELCGGHGFHSHNQVVALRQDFDVNATFAGDNTILCYETLRMAARTRPHITPDEVRLSHDRAKEASPATPAGALIWLRHAQTHLLSQFHLTADRSLSVTYAGLSYSAAILDYWSNTEKTVAEEALCGLYALDCVLRNVSTFVTAGLVDTNILADLGTEHARRCLDAGEHVDTFIELLGVPSVLINAPIAFSDYAERMLEQAAPLSTSLGMATIAA